MLILDTDHASEFQRGTSREAERLNLRLSSATDSIATTSTSIEEMMRGWMADIRLFDHGGYTNMARPPAMMEGITEFYPYCYLLVAADTALDAAKQELRGRNYHYVIAAVFSAFAVEAAVNHVGIDAEPNWAAEERKMGGWEKKLKAIVAKFSFTLDFTCGHVKTVKEAFELRDKLAHGKTWVGEQCYLDNGTSTREVSFPDWLEPYLNESRATQVIQDSRTLIQQLLVVAGFEAIDLYTMGSGDYQEVDGPARPATWKVKGT